MSYRAINWAWEAELPFSQKFVLVALADMADENDSCFPGQERIASMTGMSVSTVRRSVKALEDAGVITRHARGVSGGGRTSDRYVLNTNRSICTVRGNRSMSTPKPVNLSGETGHSDRGTVREPLEEPLEGASKRATRIPEPFMVTGEMRKWAAQEVPGVDVDASTRVFVDYWRAESGSRASKRDWVAAWRNWLRKDAPANGRQTFAQQKQNNMLGLVARAREMEQEHEAIGSGGATDVRGIGGGPGGDGDGDGRLALFAA